MNEHADPLPPEPIPAIDLSPLFDSGQIWTDESGRHWDAAGVEYVVVEVDGEVGYRPVSASQGAGRVLGYVREAGYALLDVVHDIDFHYYEADEIARRASGEAVEVEVAALAVLALAKRVEQAAGTARVAVEQAMAKLEWLVSGRPMICLLCEGSIDFPDALEPRWRICDGWAEHAACHCEDAAVEARDRAATIEEAEFAAYEFAENADPRGGVA